MGIDLVKTLVARGGHLKGNEYKALAYMAAVALDKPNEKGQPAGLYFAGWEPLAFALGVPATATVKVRQETVRRTIKGLVAKRLVEASTQHARVGTRQSYRLQLGNLSPSETEGLEPLSNRGAEPLGKSGAEPLSNRGSSPSETEGPRTQKDRGQDLSQDSTTHLPAQPHLDARGPHVFEDDEFGVGCARCPMPANHPSHRIPNASPSSGIALAGTPSTKAKRLYSQHRPAGDRR